MSSLLRVLLVDDDQTTNFLNKLLLTRLGVAEQVLTALNGEEALRMLAQQCAEPAACPQLILLDMNMPIIDGWTAASMIKAEAKTAHIPIIALTAHAMSGDREKAIAAGCNDYHPKPVDFSRLLAQIEALGGGQAAPAGS